MEPTTYGEKIDVPLKEITPKYYEKEESYEKVEAEPTSKPYIK